MFLVPVCPYVKIILVLEVLQGHGEKVFEEQYWDLDRAGHLSNGMGELERDSKRVLNAYCTAARCQRARRLKMFASLVASFALQRSAKQARRLKMFSGLVALFALHHSANEVQPKFALFW